MEALFSDSAAALEQAAGVLLHAATVFIALEGPLPGLFAEQAGALLAVAARFEEAADLTRSPAPENGRGGANARDRPGTIDGYRDADGTAHEVLVGAHRDGRWQVVDASDAGERVVDTLDGYDDDRPQAEAVARITCR